MSNIYTTTRGVPVKFLGIAGLVAKVNAQFMATKPVPPTYEIKTAAGGTEIHAHDSTTVTTEQEKTTYADYLNKLAEWNASYARSMTRVAMSLGLEAELPKTDAWVTRHKALGFDVPDDPEERRLYYIENEVLGGKQDYEALMVGVMRASGVAEEALSAAESLFRGQLERATAQGIE